ncbi:FAD-dependent oxidoreductase [Sulfurimonas aquatica]|uniref:FAD-dependent oxidoreductase n=1 Tax=Sulfurimonas aquatica TaxID=2672570 RepID=A0A975AZW1_9BACT|nr:FAD-dependent oxidoreductase [Sulfurimonas aquatica]QSZ41659.1 FAD-dependent oxidoreductase [Sulfurimonas aquatica]
MYDIAIVGAGINGCSMAYELHKEGKKVILFDMDGIASGGSGAAGAFISPKFSKSGELKEILGEAFTYSMTFYEKNFPECFKKSPLLHIAKDEAEAQTLKEYKEKTSLELLSLSSELNESVSINAGIVDAKSMCEAMVKGVKLVKQKVESLVYDDTVWVINESYSVKEVVLATGAYEGVIKEPYLELRGVWGHRIDIKTTTNNPHSIHQFVSISPSEHGELAIGATHNVHYHPQKNADAYDINSGREELLEKASRSIELENVEVIRDYMGLRSGSFDYMPLIGRVVLSSETLLNKTLNFKVKKADYSEYEYYPNLYMINGSGGYGFVLAPYLANILKSYITGSDKISDRVSPARFFARWAKKNDNILI